MKKCPNCGETNLNDALRCICGHEFKIDTYKSTVKRGRPIKEGASIKKYPILGISISVIAIFIAKMLWPDTIGLRQQELTTAIITEAFLQFVSANPALHHRGPVHES